MEKIPSNQIVLDKTKGQIFTPEEVVTYMVNTSFDELKKTNLYQQNGFYRILEPACGDGRFVKKCLDYADNYKLVVQVIAIDIDKRWVDYCQENIKDSRIKFVCENTLLIKSIGNFDLVIGNPPYVQLQKDGGALGKQFEKQGYEVFAKTGDLYQLFYEKSVSCLSARGIACLITSNKWLRAGYGEKLRKFFLTKTKPLILFDLGGDVFDSATVDSNILVCQKKV